MYNIKKKLNKLFISINLKCPSINPKKFLNKVLKFVKNNINRYRIINHIKIYYKQKNLINNPRDVN